MLSVTSPYGRTCGQISGVSPRSRAATADSPP